MDMHKLCLSFLYCFCLGEELGGVVRIDNIKNVIAYVYIVTR